MTDLPSPYPEHDALAKRLVAAWEPQDGTDKLALTIAGAMSAERQAVFDDWIAKLLELGRRRPERVNGQRRPEDPAWQRVLGVQQDLFDLFAEFRSLFSHLVQRQDQLNENMAALQQGQAALSQALAAFDAQVSARLQALETGIASADTRPLKLPFQACPKCGSAMERLRAESSRGSLTSWLCPTCDTQKGAQA